MRKTDKKIDNSIREVLTEVCDVAQVEFDGFEWLTHFVQYDRFPASLSVVCIFDSNENLLKADQASVCSLIQQKLASIDIKLKDIRKHVRFDTEEQCLLQHNGKWNMRFQE